MSTAVFEGNWLDAESDRMVRALSNQYADWHQKPVKRFVEKQFTFPQNVFCAGRAVSIVYSSDKWEKDGDAFTYVHDFSSGPSLYRTTPKTGAGKDTRKLLGVDDLNGLIPMVQLAHVLEIVVENSHKRWTIAFASRTPLMSLLDRKTLVILHRQPIFIKGGKMSVRAPGITK